MPALGDSCSSGCSQPFGGRLMKLPLFDQSRRGWPLARFSSFAMPQQHLTCQQQQRQCGESKPIKETDNDSVTGKSKS